MTWLEWVLTGSLLFAAIAGLALSVVTREPGGWYQWGDARRRAVRWLFWSAVASGAVAVVTGVVVIGWRVVW